jgi:small ligand-binding sensory domain FIST
MKPFRAASGSGEDWLSACDDCLSALDGLAADVNVGVVYAGSSFAHALDLIATRLSEATGIGLWVGTGGSGVCDQAAGGFRDKAISVMAAALPPDGIRPFDGLETFAGAEAYVESEGQAAIAIVHGDPRQIKTPALIERLARTSGAFLVGGMTSALGDGVMQIAKQPTEGGLSGMLLSTDIPIVTGLTQGCAPIGPVRTVTGIDGPWVTALDDRPALACLKEDVGPLLARDLERMSGFILAARPEIGGNSDDYLVRTLGEVDPIRNYIVIDDDLRPGDSICFVKRDPEGARAGLRRLVSELKGQAGRRPILGGLYHSSIGRGRHLFGTDEAELSILKDELGDVPLSGFQTNGEIYRDCLYGYAAVLTLFLGEAKE